MYVVMVVGFQGQSERNHRNSGFWCCWLIRLGLRNQLRVGYCCVQVLPAAPDAVIHHIKKRALISGDVVSWEMKLFVSELQRYVRLRIVFDSSELRPILLRAWNVTSYALSVFNPYIPPPMPGCHLHLKGGLTGNSAATIS